MKAPIGHAKRMRDAQKQERIRKAAPALLEALERAREDIILYRVDACLEPTDCDVIEIIDAAIKLAKGDL